VPSSLLKKFLTSPIIFTTSSMWLEKFEGAPCEEPPRKPLGY
jgi:hypothetical protein